jgi:hypothetical protein
MTQKEKTRKGRQQHDEFVRCSSCSYKKRIHLDRVQKIGCKLQ